MPEEGVLTLEELHHIIGDVWLTRFDEDLEEEKAARRKGRPKSAKETKLEDLKLRESEEYRTGMGEHSVCISSWHRLIVCQTSRGPRPDSSADGRNIPTLGPKGGCLHPTSPIHTDLQHRS